MLPRPAPSLFSWDPEARLGDGGSGRQVLRHGALEFSCDVETVFSVSLPNLYVPPRCSRRTLDPRPAVGRQDYSYRQGVLRTEGADPPLHAPRSVFQCGSSLHKGRTPSVPSKSLKRPLWPKMRQEVLRQSVMMGWERTSRSPKSSRKFGSFKSSSFFDKRVRFCRVSYTNPVLW
jgi:hypothetical protein